MAETINAVLDRIEARQRNDAIEGADALSFLQAIYRSANVPLPVQDARGDRGVAFRKPEAVRNGDPSG